MTSLLLVLSMCAQPADTGREMAMIEVHEWGVLTVDDCGAVLATAPAQPSMMPEDPYPMVERAPVIYFYGPPFSGRFTVTVPGGSVTETWPWPTIIADREWTWSILSAGWEELDSVNPLIVDIVSGWEAAPWRVPQSMTLRIGESSYEKFIFYEAGISDISFLPLRVVDGEPEVADGWESLPVALVFSTGGDPRVVACSAGDLECPVRLCRDLIAGSPADLREILYGWSVDLVDIDEVDALWATWRNWFFGEGLPAEGSGGCLALYLLPPELAGMVSVIELTPEPAYQVRYGRYLICAMELDLGGN